MIHSVRLAIAHFSGIEGDVVVEVEASDPHDAKQRLGATLTKLVEDYDVTRPEPAPCHRGAACAKGADRFDGKAALEAKVASLRNEVEEHRLYAAQLANDRNSALDTRDALEGQVANLKAQLRHESLFTAELEAALTASNVGRPLVLAPEHQDVTALRERAKATEDELLAVRRVVAQHERTAGEWRAEVGKLTRERDAETKRSDDLEAREPQVIVDGHRLVRYVPPGDGSGLDASGRLVHGPVT